MVENYLNEVEQMKDLSSLSQSFLDSKTHITRDDESVSILNITLSISMCNLDLSDEITFIFYINVDF